jgi:hypothetical protein
MRVASFPAFNFFKGTIPLPKFAPLKMTSCLSPQKKTGAQIWAVESCHSAFENVIGQKAAVRSTSASQPASSVWPTPGNGGPWVSGPWNWPQTRLSSEEHPRLKPQPKHVLSGAWGAFFCGQAKQTMLYSYRS